MALNWAKLQAAVGYAIQEMQCERASFHIPNRKLRTTDDAEQERQRDRNIRDWSALLVTIARAKEAAGTGPRAKRTRATPVQKKRGLR